MFGGGVAQLVMGTPSAVGLRPKQVQENSTFDAVNPQIKQVCTQFD